MPFHFDHIAAYYFHHYRALEERNYYYVKWRIARPLALKYQRLCYEQHTDFNDKRHLDWYEED